MTIGHTGYVIECQPGASLAASVPPCVDIAGAFYQPVIVQAYVIEPASASFFDGLDIPFDYSTAAQFWAWGFIGVATFWLIGLVCSKLIEPIWK